MRKEVRMEIKKCQNTPAFKANLGEVNTKKIANVFGDVGLNIVERFMPKVIMDDFCNKATTVDITAREESNKYLEIIAKLKLVPEFGEAKSFVGKVKNKIKSFVLTRSVSSTKTLNAGVVCSDNAKFVDERMDELCLAAFEECCKSKKATSFKLSEHVRNVKKLEKQLKNGPIQTPAV